MLQMKILKIEVIIVIKTINIQTLKLFVPLNLFLRVIIVNGRILKQETFKHISLLIIFLSVVKFSTFNTIGVDADPKPRKLAVKFAHSSSNTSPSLIL